MKITELQTEKLVKLESEISKDIEEYKISGRNIVTVIRKILDVIPDDFTNGDRFLHEVMHLCNDIVYMAPETFARAWSRLTGLLRRNMPEPDGNQWVLNVIKLFNGTE